MKEKLKIKRNLSASPKNRIFKKKIKNILKKNFFITGYHEAFYQFEKPISNISRLSLNLI